MPRLTATPAEAKMVMMEVRGMPMTLAADRTMTTMRTSLMALRKKDCREGSSLEKALLFRRNFTSQWTTNRPTTRMMIPMSRLTPAVVKNVFSFSISIVISSRQRCLYPYYPVYGGPCQELYENVRRCGEDPVPDRPPPDSPCLFPGFGLN